MPRFNLRTEKTFEDAQLYNNQFVRTRADVYVDKDILTNTRVYQPTPVAQRYDPKTNRTYTHTLGREFNYEIPVNEYRHVVGNWSSEHGRYIQTDPHVVNDFNKRLERSIRTGEPAGFTIHFRENFQRDPVQVRARVLGQDNIIDDGEVHPLARQDIIRPPRQEEPLGGLFGRIFERLFGRWRRVVNQTPLGQLANDSQNVHTSPVVEFALGRIEKWEEFANGLSIPTNTLDEQTEIITRVFDTSYNDDEFIKRVYNFKTDYLGPDMMSRIILTEVCAALGIPTADLDVNLYFNYHTGPDRDGIEHMFDNPGASGRRRMNNPFAETKTPRDVNAMSWREIFAIIPDAQERVDADIERMKDQGYSPEELQGTRSFFTSYYRDNLLFFTQNAPDVLQISYHYDKLVVNGITLFPTKPSRLRIRTHRVNRSCTWVVGRNGLNEDDCTTITQPVASSKPKLPERYLLFLSKEEHQSTFQKREYTFGKILALLCIRILHDPEVQRNKDEVIARIQHELKEGEKVCFTGKVTRLCNAMIGMEYTDESIDLTSSLEKLNKIAYEVVQALQAEGITDDSPGFSARYKDTCRARFATEVPNASGQDVDAVLGAFDF
jgi:hypothetical protein